MLLDKRLEEWSKGDMTPSIAARVLRHGQLAFEGAYGILGPGKGEASLTTDAIFPVSSITKPIISTILAIMQEEGLLELNDPVRQYIPEFIGDADGEIRIWHLLTHTSGIIDDELDKNIGKYITDILGLCVPGEDAGEEEWNEIMLKARGKMGLPALEPGQKMRSDTYLAICLKIPPAYKPRKAISYSNSGFHIATEIINRLSGKRIDEFATEKLFAPLNMKDSYFLFPPEKLSRFVTRGDGFIGQKWLNHGILQSESGAGGLKSTVHDMTRFGQMYLNKGALEGNYLLSPYSIRELTRDHNIGITGSGYFGTDDSSQGLGWNIKGLKQDGFGMLRSAGSYEHGGFGCCTLMIDPEADIVAAYFTVCRTDTYEKAANFCNLIIGALTD
jgi:CubicO group peptidase (beta-lactamase class C family)